MVNFSKWLATLRAEDNPHAVATYPADRKCYFELFMVWQARQKKCKVGGVASKVVGGGTNR